VLFDEQEFFGTIAGAGVRALLIGRRALIAYGLPVLTADYDLWVHIDDIEPLNQALDSLELAPNHPPEGARKRGRYVLENDEHIDVLVARSKSTPDGVRLAFDDAWARRNEMSYEGSASIALPAMDDLITTKRWAMRQGRDRHQDAQDPESWPRRKIMSGVYVDPKIAQQVETPLEPREFNRRISAPISDEERAETLELIAWFMKRYPTVKQRLAYARRKFDEVTDRKWCIRSGGAADS